MSDLGLLNRCPVVPVVVLDDPDQALPLGKALLAGGIDVIEITLRTDAGLEAIRRLRQHARHARRGRARSWSRSRSTRW